MARKSSRNRIRDDRAVGAIGEIYGIVIIGCGLLLLASLFSYDKADIAFNTVNVNDPAANWIGPVGAYVAFGLFFVFGLAAFFLPVGAILMGASAFFEGLAILRRRWYWMIGFLISVMGPLELYRELFDAPGSVSASGSPGGILGIWMQLYIFRLFGQIGATTIYGVLYLVSLLYLTDFQLKTWSGRLWQVLKRLFARGEGESSPFDSQESELQKKVKALEEEASRLQKQVDERDLPEPVIRDTSLRVKEGASEEAKVEKKKKARKRRLFSGNEEKTGDAPAELAPIDDPKVFGAVDSAVVGEGETISGEDVVAAASVDEILGAASRERALDRAEEASGAAGATASAAPKKKRLAAKKPKAPKEGASLAVATPPSIGDYKLPTMDMLHLPDPHIKPTETKEELMGNARLMQTTLEQFGIKVGLGDITKGPTITRYELHPAPGVRLERIVNLTNNITAALAAESIHILAPVPGKSSVGVEVPNRVKTAVVMRDLMESDKWRKSRAKIPLALGKDVYGEPLIGDLAEMPHLLIAGSTGSGKSVAINSIIASLLYKFSPEELRLVMIDPKVVELQQYNSLPHLVVPVVTDPKKVVLALRWVVNEMEKRYQIFAKAGVRNIHSFNKRPKKEPEKKEDAEPELPLTVNKENVEAGAEGFAVEVDEEIVVPRDDEIDIPDTLSYIVVIIDELADLMLVAPADVEMAIARITQMARAAGIHCIIATQRPSVNVITGVIKANIPARIAFQVAAKVDSRTILDAMGADKLLGKGDMLYLPPGSSNLIRSQGVLITDEEIQSVVDSIVVQSQPSYEADIHKQLQKPVASIDLKNGDGGDNADEEIIERCIEVIRSEQKASVSLLQRRLRLGYTRAARIMDQLEDRGIVGPSRGAEPREILMDLDEDPFAIDG